MHTHFKSATTPCLVLLTVLLAACSSGPTVTEQRFGDSVRQMVRAQVHDPDTLSRPAEGAIDGTDGQQLENALEAYRGDVARRGAVGGALEVGTGEGR